VYEEVEHDGTALPQAAGVVALAGLARGVGAFGQEGLLGVVGGVAGGFLLWAAAGIVIWLVGVKSFGCDSDLRELLRTLGFASAPLLLLALGLVPVAGLQWPVWILGHGLALAAAVVASRQALEVETGRALWICVLAFALGLVLLSLLALLFVAPVASQA
jgi:hypothetical protein